MKTAASATFVPVPERTENDVEYNIVGWMRAQGWIAERNPVGLLYTKDGRPHPVGKPGACDWRFKRSRLYSLDYMEIECKAPGKKPDKRQLEYMATMKASGVVAVWFDSLDAFMVWYGGVVARAEHHAAV